MLRQLALCLTILCAGCASLNNAFAPAPNPWPVKPDGRMRRDERILRVHGSSPKTKADADTDAKQSLETWLWTLDLGDDIPARQALIDSVLSSPAAQPVPSPVHELSGYNSIIELDLPSLQNKLGTHYE